MFNDNKIYIYFIGAVKNNVLGADIIRPQNDGLPTKVYISVFIMDLDSIDTTEQQFEANMLLLLKWHDSRPAPQGKEIVRKPLTEVWNPRLQAVNQQKLWLYVKVYR